MKITTYIKKNWATLPKSVFTDGNESKELVIVREINNWDEGWGHHSYEGIGVDAEGKVFSAHSSGCSCNGDTSWGETGEALTENWQDVEFARLEVSFSTY